MNIAYLDPPYSRYFERLCECLTQQTGGLSVGLLSSPAYRMYCRGHPIFVWGAGEMEPGCPLPTVFKRMEWARANPDQFGRVLAHAVDWFKVRFQEQQIDVCLLYSDARPFSVAARIAAQQSGVVCVFFERGVFRNRTASLSTLGLNSRFDIVSARRLRGVVGLSEADIPPYRSTERWLKLRFVVFLMRNALTCMMNTTRRVFQYKRFDLVNYARIAINQFLLKYHARANRGLERVDHELVRTQAPIVLLSLQLETDSQFVMHSPFRSNQELIDFTVPRIISDMPEARILVRKHPMDVHAYRLPAGAERFRGNLAWCCAQAKILICVNSTVGFEVAAQGKTVLCFGSSFYTGDPHIVQVTPDNFSEQLRFACRRPDNLEAGQSLKAAILQYYQSPGDVWAYTEEDLQATAAIVLQHVHAARSAPELMRSSGAA